MLQDLSTIFNSLRQEKEYVLTRMLATRVSNRLIMLILSITDITILNSRISSSRNIYSIALISSVFVFLISSIVALSWFVEETSFRENILALEYAIAALLEENEADGQAPINAFIRSKYKRPYVWRRILLTQRIEPILWLIPVFLLTFYTATFNFRYF